MTQYHSTSGVLLIWPFQPNSHATLAINTRLKTRPQWWNEIIRWFFISASKSSFCSFNKVRTRFYNFSLRSSGLIRLYVVKVQLSLFRQIFMLLQGSRESSGSAIPRGMALSLPFVYPRRWENWYSHILPADLIKPSLRRVTPRRNLLGDINEENCFAGCDKTA